MHAGRMILLLLPSLLAAQSPTNRSDDAATPVARFMLRDTPAVVTRGDLALEMAFSMRRKDEGRAACAQLVKTHLVRTAAAAAGVWPEEAVVRTRWDELQRQLEASGRHLADEPLMRNCSEAVLLDYLAVDLAHEQLVRKQLSLRRDEQVSAALLELWVKEAAERTKVVDDPDQLPLGVAVKVGDDSVPLLELGMLLLRGSNQEEQDKFVRRVVLLQLLEDNARQAHIEASTQDLENEMSLRRALAQNDPRFRGISYEQLLQSQGLTPATLVQSRVFRAHVLQKKLVAARHPQHDLLAEIERDRTSANERFGPRRHLAVVFVRALDEPNELVPRDFAKAMDHLTTLKKQLSSTSFEATARAESDEPGSRARGGEIGWLQRRDTALPEAVMATAWSLKDNEVSDPVRTENGCYLVKVLGVEPEVDDRTMIMRMREQFADDYTDELLRAAKITRADGTVLPVGRGADAGR